MKSIDYETMLNLLLKEKASVHAENRIDIMVKKQKLKCLEKCSTDKKCYRDCMIYLYQHVIGALKTTKSKCKDKKCMDKIDEQIKKFADKITAIGKK